MSLRYTFDLPEDADLIEQAVNNVLAKGLRTPDIMAKGMAAVSTATMTDALIQELDKMAA
jgi:3-isopropylmalate dehydrogenase